MSRLIPTSMRARLMLLVLLVIVPMLGLLLYTSFEERRIAAIDARDNALTLAQLLKADQERRVEGARQLLIALAKLADVRVDDPEACAARLGDLLKLYPDYSGFGVAGPDGDIVCSTVPPPRPINAVQEQIAWYQRAVETRSFAVGDYQEGPRTGEPILAFAYPILDDEDQLHGVVFAVIRLAALNQLADEAGLPPEAELVAIDRNGTVLDRHPRPDESVGKSLPEAPLIQLILSQHEGATEVAGLDGVTRLYAFTPVQSSVETGLYLSVGIPLQAAFAEADQRLARNVGALGLIAALTIAAALYFSDLFVMRRMNALVKTTQRLKHGDLSARSVGASDMAELDQLARAFNDMAATLEQREVERKRAEQSQRLLAEASQLLVASLDYGTQLNNVAQLVVPEMADWCVIDELDGDRQIQRVVVAHIDPDKVAYAEELRRRYPPNLDAPSGVSHVLRTGQSEFYPEISDSLLEATVKDAQQLRILRELGLKSAIVVPLTTGGRTLGALTLVWAESDRHYTPADVTLAEELARRMALALDNARSYRAEQQARQEAERSAGRIARLQALTASLAQVLTPAEVADVCLKQMVAALGASAGSIQLLTRARKEFEVIGHVGYPPGYTENPRRLTSNPASPLEHVLHIGQPVFLESRQQALEQYSGFEPDLASVHNAWAAIPLVVEDRAIGAIDLAFSGARVFSAEDREFLTVLSGQCAQAIERARLYAAEREARAQAESAQQRMTFLAEAGQTLMAKTDLDARLENVTRLIVPRLADWCTIHLIEADGSIRLLTAAHRDLAQSADILELGQLYPIDPEAPSGVPLVLRTGKPEIAAKVSDDLLSEIAEGDDHRRRLQELGLESYLIVPLVARGRTLGAMTLASTQPSRRYTQPALALVEDLADRVALSVDNALLYQETHQLNAELEQQVEKRTAQLQASNDRLRRQMAERRQAEEALQRSQRRYEELVDAVNDIVWEADAQTFEFQFVSRQAERLLDYPITRWITEPTFWIDHIHPDDRAWVIEYSTAAIADKRPYEFEYRMLADDGRTVWLRNIVTVVAPDDRPEKVRGVMTDITKRKHAEAELAEIQRRMIDSRESERLHLAQELHDGPVQDLYGITYQLAGLRDTRHDGVTAEQLAAMQQGLNQVIQTLRSIMSELRPPTLAPFGLEKAIRSHAERFQEVHPELELHLDLIPDQQQLPEPVRLALFRIYQQALTNVVRHADARQINIRFSLEAEQAQLEIEDDGRGFEVPARWIGLVRQGHLGLAGAAERAGAVGGQLNVISAPGQGTHLQVSVPYGQQDNGSTR